MSTLVWFRDDLRLADNPALQAALERDEPVVCLFVLDEVSPGFRPLGGAARWWLHHSLASLGERIRERGGMLLLRRGPASEVVPRTAAEVGATAVAWNRRYAAAERDVDRALKDGMREAGLEVRSFAGSLLFEPWTVRTGADTPFSVFTPFWRRCLHLRAPRRPLPEPDRIPGPDTASPSDDLDDWMLLPTAPDWAGGMRETWEPGEPAAQARLRAFLAEDAARYERARDEPAAGATSLLSPRLRWGELSPYTVWHAALEAEVDAGRFLAELGWREFAWHVLFHHPDLAVRSLQPAFDAFPWPPHDPERLHAWQRGRTGYPIVDAGMRELRHTGHMHNRVRMITASFLVKNLLIDWRHGEQWFWDTLVDADQASNAFNWQWVAGSGADAAPYFRVFNPMLQQQKFDRQGLYRARWAPDAADTPPIVDFIASRNAALRAYEQVKHARRAPAD